VEKAILLKTYFPDQEEYRSSGVQEFRSSGVQEFRSSEVQKFRRILNLERTEDKSDLTGLFLGFKPPLNKVSAAPFQAGSESLSQRHSELLNSSILNSFQVTQLVQIATLLNFNN
jgi:hypothetical protein